MINIINYAIVDCKLRTPRVSRRTNDKLYLYEIKYESLLQSDPDRMFSTRDCTHLAYTRLDYNQSIMY